MGKKGTVVFLGWQKFQGLVVTLKTEKRCEKINGRV